MMTAQNDTHSGSTLDTSTDIVVFPPPDAEGMPPTQKRVVVTHHMICEGDDTWMQAGESRTSEKENMSRLQRMNLILLPWH